MATLTMHTNLTLSGSKNLVVGGDLTVNGTTTTVNTSTLTVDDSMIKLASGNTADTVDIGFYGMYNDGAAKIAGMAKKFNSDKFYLFSGITHDEASDNVITDDVPAVQSGELYCKGINTNGTITHDGAAVSLTASAASEFITSSGALTLNGAGGVNIAGNGEEIDITTTGALDINAAATTIDSSAGVAVTAATASSFTTSAGALTLDGAAGVIIDGNVTGVTVTSNITVESGNYLKVDVSNNGIYDLNNKNVLLAIIQSLNALHDVMSVTDSGGDTTWLDLNLNHNTANVPEVYGQLAGWDL